MSTVLLVFLLIAAPLQISAFKDGATERKLERGVSDNTEFEIKATASLANFNDQCDWIFRNDGSQGISLDFSYISLGASGNQTGINNNGQFGNNSTSSGFGGQNVTGNPLVLQKLSAAIHFIELIEFTSAPNNDFSDCCDNVVNVIQFGQSGWGNIQIVQDITDNSPSGNNGSISSGITTPGNNNTSIGQNSTDMNTRLNNTSPPTQVQFTSNDKMFTFAAFWTSTESKLPSGFGLDADGAMVEANVTGYQWHGGAQNGSLGNVTGSGLNGTIGGNSSTGANSSSTTRLAFHGQFSILKGIQCERDTDEETDDSDAANCDGVQVGDKIVGARLVWMNTMVDQMGNSFKLRATKPKLVGGLNGTLGANSTSGTGGLTTGTGNNTYDIYWILDTDQMPTQLIWGGAKLGIMYSEQSVPGGTGGTGGTGGNGTGGGNGTTGGGNGSGAAHLGVDLSVLALLLVLTLSFSS
jgi:hypothetical protein